MQKEFSKYRWTICGLIFFATTINYIDRNVISFMKSTFTKDMGWSDGDYANIEIVFKLFYAIGMLFAGRIIDKLGTKLGYGIFTLLWSIARGF
jgi:MFS transporter, ACS family, hexuronate transporter